MRKKTGPVDRKGCPAFWRQAAALSTMLVPLALSACQSTPDPTPDQMSRNAAQTAPADLQLLCANAAAQSGGVDANRVLPVGSRKFDARTYQVELNVTGQKMNCMVDDDGKILSVGAA